MKCLIFILALVAATYAQSKCSTTPTQWFGYFREIGWDNDEAMKLVFRIANASYDRDAQMMKVMDTKVEFGNPLTVTLSDYKNKVEYKVVSGKCTKSTLSGDIPSFGVPDSAKYELSEFIGASLPNLGVLVNEYYNIVPNENIYLGSYSKVSGDTCIPIMISELSVRPKLAMDLIYFANLTTTLPPDAFSIPSECK